MKYCTHCGAEIDDDAIYCPKCGVKTSDNTAQFTNYASVDKEQTSTSYESKAPKVLGILSIIFGALGGIAGLICGIIGLCIDKEKKYKALNIVGICLFAAWVLILIIL